MLKRKGPFLICLLFSAFAGLRGLAQLKADFTADKLSGCLPLQVKFQNTSTGTGNGSTYEWDFGNGNTSDLPNAAAIFSEEKNYTVTLTVRNGSQTSTHSVTIRVYPKPSAAFSSASAKGCLPFNAQFTAAANTGGGAITQYYWDFGDGSTASSPVPGVQHAYSSTGYFPASLTVTNEYGCTNSTRYDSIVQILPALSVDFSADRTILCHANESVSFQNNSQGPGTLSYNWDFGDGQSSSAASPTHTYAQKGIYDVTLTVSSSEGCSLSKTRSALLSVGTYQSSFTYPSQLCHNDNITFTSTSSPYPDQARWQVNGMDYYSNGNQFQYQFPAAGTYNVSLINRFGTCLDTLTKSIAILPSPAAGFVIGPVNACGAPATVTFDDTTSNVVSRVWKFDWPNTGASDTRANTSYAYTENRFYLVNLQVTGANGCRSSITQGLRVAATEVNIYYTASTGMGTVGCGSFSISWAASSSEPIRDFDWDFGDGSHSTEATPTHLFQTEGTFQVKLNYTTTGGCKGTAYYNGITVYGMPKADFVSASSTEICGNTPVHFSDLSTGPITYRGWDYGDGIPNYGGIVAMHQYQAEGTYTVRLIVQNAACSDTATRADYIQVKPPFPKLSSFINTCEGDRGQVTINQLSTGADSLTWIFDDGTQLPDKALLPQVSHHYPASGSFLVRLKATRGDCTVSDSLSVLVLKKQYPVVTADKTELCQQEHLNYIITGLTGNPGFNINLYTPYWPVEWQYDDLSQFPGEHVVGDAYTPVIRGWVSGMSPAQDSMRVFVKSAYFGCIDTSNYIPVKIRNVSAGFKIVSDSNCVDMPVRLLDTSTAAGNTQLKSWTWDFGDGQVVTNALGGEVQHAYSLPGNYTVSLKVTDNSGCSNTPVYSSRPVLVHGPLAAFNTSASSITIGESITVYNTTNLTATGPVTWTWDFGDGMPASGAFSPGHTYSVAGTYTITLSAVDPATACRSTASRNVLVKPLEPGFLFSKQALSPNSCPPVLYRFSNNAVNAVRVEWDFGDGFASGNVSNPSHIYERPGTYVVTQTVYGSGGLSRVYTDTVLIGLPSVNLLLNNAEGCPGQRVRLSASDSSLASYTWDFGDGELVAQPDDSITHVYVRPGNYRPVLMVKDVAGCLVARAADSVVLIHPNPELSIQPSAPAICLGSSAQLNVQGALFYRWRAANGLTDTLSASPVVSPVYSTYFFVTGTDSFGCRAGDSVWVKVIPPTQLELSADTSVCFGDTIQLRANGADQYTWIGFTEGLDNPAISSPRLIATQTGTYTVIGGDGQGCFTDTGLISVVVHPLPQVNAGPDADAVAGSPVSLQATGSPDIVTWSWTPDTWLNCSDCPNPVSRPGGDMVYRITVTNAMGCRAVDELVIKVQCSELLVRIPNAFTPNGDGHNDVFMIQGISRVKHLTIFNRWGQKIFDRSNFLASDRASCWDGAFRGQPVESGSYVYFVEMECPNGGSFNRKGTVTLIR